MKNKGCFWTMHHLSTVSFKSVTSR